MGKDWPLVSLVMLVCNVFLCFPLPVRCLGSDVTLCVSFTHLCLLYFFKLVNMCCVNFGRQHSLRKPVFGASNQV